MSESATTESATAPVNGSASDDLLIEVDGKLVPNYDATIKPFAEGGPLVVGLTNDPTALVAVRRNRLRLLNENRETGYTDPERVREEVQAARRLFGARGWPVLETSRRSIEETAASILALLQERRLGKG